MKHTVGSRQTRWLAGWLAGWLPDQAATTLKGADVVAIKL